MHPLIKQCQTQWTMKFITFLALQPGIIWRVHGREEGLVYLMLRPIAQCQADASGNFRKAVAKGKPSKRQRAVSAISKAGGGLIKGEAGKERQQLQREPRRLHWLLDFWLRQTSAQPASLPCAFYLPERSELERLNNLTLHFLRACMHGDVTCMQSWPL